MSLRQQIRSALLLLLKHTLNPLTCRLARSSHGPFSIIRHVGRRSGKLYETPIIVAPHPGGFVIELTYGPEVDRHKNIVAAGGGTVVHRGKEYPFNREGTACELITSQRRQTPPQRESLHRPCYDSVCAAAEHKEL